MSKNRGKRKTKGSKGFNRKNTEEFLSRNRTKPGVAETVSGLQYLVIEDAQGSRPTENSIVEVQQRISLVDGTIIADTYKQTEPARFTLAEAIEGYREGLLMMSRGARYRFFIPPDLGWGKRGAGNKIGPNAVLIIDARLISIA